MTDFDLWPPDKPGGEPTQQDIDAAVAHLRSMAEQAAGLDTKRCVWGGEPMLWLPFQRALVPGHVYSHTGRKEAKISGCCEYHFDRAFEPGWVDPVTGEPGMVPAER